MARCSAGCRRRRRLHGRPAAGAAALLLPPPFLCSRFPCPWRLDPGCPGRRWLGAASLRRGPRRPCSWGRERGRRRRRCPRCGLGGNLVSWSSKRQPVVSRSSAEAEYRAVANGVAEASWLRQLLAELHSPLAKSTLVYCDNVSAVYLSTNPVQHQRTKHVEIDLHFALRLLK